MFIEWTRGVGPHLSNTFLKFKDHSILFELLEGFGGFLALSECAESSFGRSVGLDLGLGRYLVVRCDGNVGCSKGSSDLARDEIPGKRGSGDPFAENKAIVYWGNRDVRSTDIDDKRSSFA